MTVTSLNCSRACSLVNMLRIVGVWYDFVLFFFFSSRRRHTRSTRDWSSDVCSSDLVNISVPGERLSLGTLMLTQLLRAEGYAIDYFTDLPDDELLAFISEVRPEAVFISCTNPDHLEPGFGLIQLIAASFPDLMIVAGGSAFARDRQQTLAAGATYVPSTLAEAKEDFLTQRKAARRKSGRRITFSGTRLRVPPPA